MTLEEAIKVLEQFSHELEGVPLEHTTHAIKLGIEALKLIRRNRRYTPQPYNVKLPGETVEKEVK